MRHLWRTMTAAALGLSLVFGSFTPASVVNAKDVSVVFDFNGVAAEDGSTEFTYPYLPEGEALGGISATLPRIPHKVFVGWSTDPAGRGMIEDTYEFYPQEGQRIYAIWKDAYVVTLKAGSGARFEPGANGYFSEDDTHIGYLEESETEFSYNVEENGRFGLGYYDALVSDSGLLFTGWKAEDGTIHHDEYVTVDRDMSFTPVWGTAEPESGKPYITNLVLPAYSTAEISFNLADVSAAGGNEALNVGFVTSKEVSETGVINFDDPYGDIMKDLFYWRDHEGGIYYHRAPTSAAPETFQLLTKDRLENKTGEGIFLNLVFNYPVKDLKYTVTSRSDVYRLYNPNTGEHLYTPDRNEYNVLGTIGWQQENVGFISLGLSENPIYRVYNPNAGDHHYTTNYGEVQNLVSLGWEYESIVAYGGPEENEPVYRVYNPNAKGAGAHHFTSDKNERDTLISWGWKDEGIAWYGADYYFGE